MAKKVEDTFVVSVAKLVRNDTPHEEIVSDDKILEIETVVSELLGSDVLVEVYKGPTE